MPKTIVDLYRRGNASGPRLSHVRIRKDLLVYEKNGVDWVAAGSGGVSTFSAPGEGKNWWLLPAGYNYVQELVVANDHSNHYSWEPSSDIPLTDFISLLASVESAFRKVT